MQSPKPGKSASITRRAAIGALAAGGLGFALFGPRGRKTDAGNRLVLDYWEKWTGHEGAAMQRVVDAFNRSQDRLLVRYFVTSGIGQKALTSIAGGDPPDIIGLWNFNVPPYAESRAILALDELAPKHGLNLERYSPGVRQVMTHRGRWWAAVNTAGTLAMYYNKTIFREVGLDPERPPRTIQELDEAHRRIVKREASGDLSRVGFLHAEPGWWQWIWGYHFGGSLYDPGSETATVSDARNLAAYHWYSGYTRDLGFDKVERFRSGFGSYNTPENAFLTGKVAMVIQGPWLANMVEKFAPRLDYGVAPFPVEASAYRDGSPVALIDTDVLVIPRGAKNPEASMEFIAYTQRQDVTELLATAHCKGSPLTEQSEEFLATHPNRGVKLHSDLFASDRAFVCPPTRVWQEIKDKFDVAALSMWSLKQSPEDALAQMQTTTRGLLDHAAEQRRRRYGARS